MKIDVPRGFVVERTNAPEMINLVDVGDARVCGSIFVAASGSVYALGTYDDDWWRAASVPAAVNALTVDPDARCVADEDVSDPDPHDVDNDRRDDR